MKEEEEESSDAQTERKGRKMRRVEQGGRGKKMTEREYGEE